MGPVLTNPRIGLGASRSYGGNQARGPSPAHTDSMLRTGGLEGVLLLGVVFTFRASGGRSRILRWGSPALAAGRRTLLSHTHHSPAAPAPVTTCRSLALGLRRPLRAGLGRLRLNGRLEWPAAQMLILHLDGIRARLAPELGNLLAVLTAPDHVDSLTRGGSELHWTSV